MTTVEACPECDSASIKTRMANGKKGRQADGNYYCLDCQSHFDDPVERESRHQTKGGGTLRRKLLEADAEVKYD